MTTCKIYRAKLSHHQSRYDLMLQEVQNNWCWACGRGERDRPRDWYATWCIHRAHIAAKPRRQDRRAVVLLCPLCHLGGYHGERIITCERDGQWPKLLREHLLWLKHAFDPEYYDRQFLQSNTVSLLPLMHKPPIVYLDSYAMLRGNLFEASA